MKIVAMLALFSAANGKKNGNLRQKDISALEWFEAEAEEDRFLKSHLDYSIAPTPKGIPRTKHPTPEPLNCPCPDDPSFVTQIGRKKISCLYVLFSYGLPTFEPLCKTVVSYNGSNEPIDFFCQEACCSTYCLNPDTPPPTPKLTDPSTVDPPTVETLPPTTVTSSPPTCTCSDCQAPESEAEKEQRLKDFYASESGQTASEYFDDEDRSRAFIFVHPDLSDECLPEEPDLQRFVAALWYYGTTEGSGEDEWDEMGNYLTNVDECEWTGIGCDSVQIPGKFRGGRITEVIHNENGLEGTLAPEISLLTELKQLQADDNTIGGTIPNVYTALSKLRILNLDSNQLTGTLPKRIGNLKSLEVWDTDRNLLTGIIPLTINNLPAIRVIDLNDNQITGDVINKFGSLGATLTDLQLHNNQLSGRIPNSLGNLVNLEVLYLQGNNFRGKMPAECCNNMIEDIRSDCSGETPEVFCDCCTQCA
eukprot:CAMPEP_0194265876 /NCGR_PEP_ID=MMETSP0169-20130528/962_1 /TAXON_ID=218684 /ORGANISM="Corethron pennatum, Strain L29A3" /LENGTH=476 /DNA_ID=CAMNT_0039006439 /DNA_START=202 /DNA_END=1632 /DNA_ORIENTATION=-